jgi:hypothetical protein
MRVRTKNATSRAHSAPAPSDEAKVNAWEAPTQVAKWKEEHVSQVRSMLKHHMAIPMFLLPWNALA